MGAIEAVCTELSLKRLSTAATEEYEPICVPLPRIGVYSQKDMSPNFFSMIALELDSNVNLNMSDPSLMEAQAGKRLVLFLMCERGRASWVNKLLLQCKIAASW